MVKIIAILCLTLFLVPGCHKGKTDLKHNSHEYLDSSKDQIENFERSLNHARSQRVDVLAPKDFDKALTLLSEAKDHARAGDDLEDFREAIHNARIHLDRAVENSKAPIKTDSD